MKKTVCWVCAMFMAMSLAACGGSDAASSEGEKSPAASNALPNEPSNDQSYDELAESEGALPHTVESIDEQLLVDQDGIKITATELGYNHYGYPYVMLLVENNRDIAVDVSPDFGSVNGIMQLAMFTCEVAPGESVTEMLWFYEEYYARANITTIKDMSMFFSIRDTDLNEIFATEPVTITTSADPGYEQEYRSEGQVIYDQGGVRYIIQDVDYSTPEDGITINYYVENHSDKPLIVRADDVEVNGDDILVTVLTWVAAGKCVYDKIDLEPSDLEIHDIETVEELGLAIQTVEPSDKVTVIAEADMAYVTFE